MWQGTRVECDQAVVPRGGWGGEALLGADKVTFEQLEVLGKET